VAKLLQSKVLGRVGAWSFGIYILHFEVLALWGGAESGKGVGVAYWVVLLAMAALAHHYVQVPWGTDLVYLSYFVLIFFFNLSLQSSMGH